MIFKIQSQTPTPNLVVSEAGSDGGVAQEARHVNEAIPLERRRW